LSPYSSQLLCSHSELLCSGIPFDFSDPPTMRRRRCRIAAGGNRTRKGTERPPQVRRAESSRLQCRPACRRPREWETIITGFEEGEDGAPRFRRGGWRRQRGAGPEAGGDDEPIRTGVLFVNSTPKIGG
jgi:hypothetical protein